MTRLFTLFALTACFALTAPLVAQETEKEEIPEGWRLGAGIGFDFSQLLQINPKQGAGQNRLGIGGAVNSFAKYKMGRQAWDNSFLFQYGLQRLGSGVIAQGTNDRIPFQKAIDELRLNSKYGLQIKPEGELFWSANFTFVSQLTPTYQFPDVYPGNFVTDFPDTGTPPLSRLFAPATTTLSLGLDWKPNDNFSLFFSPLGSKFILVLDDDIAARGVHGNQVSGEPNDLGFFPEYEKVDAQLGALAQVGYQNTFAGDKLAFTSNLNLYSNYLRNPQNIDLDWQNGLSYAITENFQLQLLLNAFYDDDVLVQITDYDAPNGVSGLGKRVSITEQILLTYARTF